MVASASPFHCIHPKQKCQSGRACFRVVDAVFIVTRGQEMVKNDLLRNLTLFARYLTTIRVLLKDSMPKALSKIQHFYVQFSLACLLLL
jgi:hypothetical protein